MFNPFTFSDAMSAARAIVARVGPDLRVALPLGLGKPVTLVNALVRLAADDPSLKLSIFTALTLERPEPSSDMERRFLGPARDRLFGRYPDLAYARMLRDGTLPANIDVTEFFLLAGRWTSVERMQRAYVSVDFAQALDVLLARRPNLVLQLLAAEGDRLSLSCNTDISADLLRLRREGRADFLFAAELNPALPFLPGPAEIAASEVALGLDPPEPFELFSVPKRPVADADHAIGLHVSRLVPDGGTLQIGIGTTGDAVAHALRLRHRGALAELWRNCPVPADGFAETGPFDIGLYAVTEMLVDVMLPLLEEGIIAREVDGVAIHAGFFVGCRDFYARLRDLPEEVRARIAMMPVTFTNSLLGDETAKRAARRGARFVNSTMTATLLGDAASDQLLDGTVVSGVGGQFDFVSQAHQLEGARSVLALHATRHGSGGLRSNIVWSRPHVTVPRHMRDIVVTEYGIADLRGKSDADCAAAMLAIADSRFQKELLGQARERGKLPPDFRIPEARQHNLPGRVSAWLDPARDRLPAFPFGTDFTEREQRLLPALTQLGRARGDRMALARLAWQGRGTGSAEEEACVKRLELDAPGGLRDRFIAKALRGALRATGVV